LYGAAYLGEHCAGVRSNHSDHADRDAKNYSEHHGVLSDILPYGLLANKSQELSNAHPHYDDDAP
jgi:hypothetical protein